MPLVVFKTVNHFFYKPFVTTKNQDNNDRNLKKLKKNKKRIITLKVINICNNFKLKFKTYIF